MFMITLECLTIDDCENIVEWNEGKSQDFLIQWSGQGHDSYIYPITAKQIVEKMNDKKNVFYKIICSGQMVGSVCLMFHENGPVFVCRFIMGDDFRGKGYGTEALKKLSRLFFDEYDQNQLKLGVYVHNVNAIRCYENAGFRVESYSEEYKSFRMCLNKKNVKNKKL